MLRAVGIVLPIPKSVMVRQLKWNRNSLFRRCQASYISFCLLTSYDFLGAVFNVFKGQMHQEPQKWLRHTATASSNHGRCHPMIEDIEVEGNLWYWDRVKIQRCWNLQFSFNNNLKPSPCWAPKKWHCHTLLFFSVRPICLHIVVLSSLVQGIRSTKCGLLPSQSWDAAMTPNGSDGSLRSLKPMWFQFTKLKLLWKIIISMLCLNSFMNNTNL